MNPPAPAVAVNPAPNVSSTRLAGVSLLVRDLCKGYAGTAVLKGVSFSVTPGEVFVIMGPSGCGKSVLLRQLAGLEEPDAGEILIDGQKVQSPEITTRYHLAMVFQSGALLTSLTVGENVGFYLSEHRLKTPAEIQTIVAQALARVGLPGTEDRMPGELSGGMGKRVAIARALAIEPQLILYDEPTSELDPVSAVAIAGDILRLNQRTHCTTVVVSHDRDLAFGIASRIALLEDGCIIALGTPAAIKAHPDPRVQEFLQAQIIPAPEVPARVGHAFK